MPSSAIFDQYEIYLASLVGSAPYLCVLFGGAFLCIRHSRNNPRAAVLVGLALALQFADRLITPFLSRAAFTFFPAGTMDDVRLRVALNAVLYAIPDAVALGLLLYAAFHTSPRRALRADEILLQQHS